MLNVAGVAGFTDEGMLILVPRSGPTLETLILDGATKLGKASGDVLCGSCQRGVLVGQIVN